MGESIYYCPNCGEELENEFETCPWCGENDGISFDGFKTIEEHVHVTGKGTFSEYLCANCGTELIKNSTKCPSCGFPLDWSDESITTTRWDDYTR